MSSFLIQVPLRPHLIKFVHWREQLREDEVFPFSRHNYTGALIYLSLTEEVKYLRSIPNLFSKKTDTQKNKEEFKMLTMKIAANQCKDHGFYITEDGIHSLNKSLEGIFYDIILTRIKFSKEKIKTTIYDFLYELDIEEDDIPYENVIKQTYRLRKKMHLPIRKKTRWQ